jgi:hypothetical protein
MEYVDIQNASMLNVAHGEDSSLIRDAHKRNT